MGPEIYGVKWRDFKLVLIVQKYMTDSAQRLPTPRLINLMTDPHEREPVSLPHLHSWTATHVNRIIAEFQASLGDERLTPDRRALDHIPTRPDA